MAKTHSDLQIRNTSSMLNFGTAGFISSSFQFISTQNHNAAIKVQTSNGTKGLQQFLPQLFAAVGH